ncbi:DUF3253 domain-containing protein [Magnetospira sp. QH-2]|uniref:DUF3253 domain-containing protein n=1 Tax=Magnetospira sp. (strain QH-2) TaxID=1288970 RepID=UPI0003E80E2C|nr:DUF3253 domain-containing protein [Magnetospira sp. QH-2]CCQ73723.1 Protein of unknown function [Magnetospira sp. QH-2]
MTNENEQRKPDPLVTFMMSFLSDKASAGGQEIAQAYAKEQTKDHGKPVPWRRYFQAVKQQALHQARAGTLEILHKGKPIDPTEVKGVVRYRLKS